MDKSSLLTAEERWPRWHAVLVFLVFCFFMVCPAAPERWADLYSFYGKTLVVAVIALALYIKRFSFAAEVKLVWLYALWLLVSRMLNSDMYMVRESDLVLTKFLCAAVLATGLVLDAGQRRRFMNWFCLAVGLFYFCSGLLAIVVNLLDIYIYLPPEGVLFGLDEPWHIHYINVFNTNRTISSLWFYIALCMMIYQFFACRKKLWRIPIVLAGLLFYIAVGMCFSRTVKIVTAGSVAMLAILLAFKYLSLKKLWQKCLTVLLCAALLIPLSFKSFDLLSSLMSDVSGFLISETAGDQAGDQESSGVDLSDNRDLKSDISDLSERKQIYASFIPTLKTDPKRILIGSFADKLMTVPNTFIVFPIPFTHMHNFILEVFMLTGLPGFLLTAAFCLLLVIRMVHLFFTKDSRISLAEKTLTIPLTGILLYGMFEVVIFTACGDRRAPTDMRELSFFIIAGIVLGYSHDILPKLPGLKRK
ncbi:MAG TPA: hypothetical protein IAC00_08950 [Candidatus Limivicinus faecipullorum]|nr:hypothetical protein [Candidatus Limivicinus faecipullorum]